jgi:protein SCO1
MTLLLLLLAANVLPPQYVAGRPLAAVEVIDDSGRRVSTESWKGVPTILVPMYTRCPLACPMIVGSVKRAMSGASALPGSYRVVLFSFDARDTPADLRAFRQRERVPMSWTIVTAGPDGIRRLMESIDFRYTSARGEFAHPNLAVALTPDLVTAKYLFGTSLSGREIDAAMTIARGGRDWIGRFGKYALALLLVIAALSAVYLGRAFAVTA